MSSLKRKKITPTAYRNTSKIYDIKTSYHIHKSHNVLLPYIHICDMEGRIKSFYYYNNSLINYKTTKVSKSSLTSLDVIEKNGHFAYVTSSNNRIYQIFNGRIVFKQVQKENISKVCYLNKDNHNIFLAGDKKGGVSLYDTRSKSISISFGNKLKLINEEITDLKYYSHGESVIASHLNGIVSMYDIKKPLELIDLSDSVEDSINTIEIVGNSLLLGLAEGELVSISLFNLEKIERKVNVHPEGITSLLCLSDYEVEGYCFDNKFISGCEDGVLRVFDYKEMSLIGCMYDDCLYENKYFKDVCYLTAFRDCSSSFCEEEKEKEIGFCFAYSSNVDYLKVCPVSRRNEFFNEDYEVSCDEKEEEDDEKEGDDEEEKEDDDHEDEEKEDEEEDNDNDNDDKEEEDDDSDSDDDEEESNNETNKRMKNKIIKANEKYLNSDKQQKIESRKKFFEEL